MKKYKQSVRAKIKQAKKYTLLQIWWTDATAGPLGWLELNKVPKAPVFMSVGFKLDVCEEQLQLIQSISTNDTLQGEVQGLLCIPLGAVKAVRILYE